MTYIDEVVDELLTKDMVCVCVCVCVTCAGYTVTYMDEFVDELLTKDMVCDIVLPTLPKRTNLEDLGL